MKPPLRPMRETDLSSVNLIQSKSFTHSRLNSRISDGRVPLCRSSFLKMYYSANPGGCFVCEEKGRVSAYCFTRSWGKTAWLGPLAVLPSEQGKGYGRQIVQAATAFLIKQGHTVIGLELTADSPGNIAFYTKLGFVVETLTLDLVGKVPAEPQIHAGGFEAVYLSSVHPEEGRRLLNDALHLSQQFCPGLDYSSEVKLVLEHGYGDVLFLLHDGKLQAFIIAHTATYTEQEKREFLKMNVVQTAMGAPVSLLGKILTAVEDWALREALPSLYLRIPLNCKSGFDWFLSRGFQVIRSDIRMTLDGYGLANGSDHFNFSKWQ